MISFYYITLLVTLFALGDVNAQETEDICQNSEFGSVGCTCEGESIRCEMDGKLTAFPVIEGTYDTVTLM